MEKNNGELKNALIYGRTIDVSKYKGYKIDKDLEEKVSNELKEEIIKLTKTSI